MFVLLKCSPRIIPLTCVPGSANAEMAADGLPGTHVPPASPRGLSDLRPGGNRGAQCAAGGWPASVVRFMEFQLDAHGAAVSP